MFRLSPPHVSLVPPEAKSIMKSSSISSRPSRFAAAMVFALGAAASAQVIPQVVPLGGGCGNPKPSLNSTLPLLTADLTIFVTGMPAGCPLTLFITPPPAAPLPFGTDCTAWIDLGLIETFAPPYVWNGVANANGSFTATFPTVSLLGFAPGAPCNVQAVCITPPGTAGSVNFFGYEGFVTDAVQIIMGDVPLDPPTDVPPGTCCTYTRQAYGDCGPAGDIFWDNYCTCFPAGLITGIYAPSNNCYSSAPPNGKKFTTSYNATYKLWDYLYFSTNSSCGTNSYYSADQLNSSSANGAGNFGRETAGLALNIGFSDCGVIGDNCVFGDLVYICPGSSLNGLTVRQILAAANNALAGCGYPAGFNNASFRTLVTELNCSFIDCQPSAWASTKLWRANAGG